MRTYLIESTLLQNNISRAYKLQMELQSTLVHEALAAVVALDRRVQLRADLRGNTGSKFALDVRPFEVVRSASEGVPNGFNELDSS